MTLSKILLTLGVVFALAQKAQSNDQAALICELGGVYGEMSNYPLYPCYSSFMCGYEISAVDYFFPGLRWNWFDYSAMYHLYCDDTTSMVGICYYSGGSYWFTDSCTGGQEAVMLHTSDYQRRQLRQDDGAFDGPELEVEIDGQMVTLLNPHFHET